MAPQPEYKPSSPIATAMLVLGALVLIFVMSVGLAGCRRTSGPQSGAGEVSLPQNKTKEKAESVAHGGAKEVAPESKAEKVVEQPREVRPTVEEKPKLPPTPEPVKPPVVVPWQAALDTSAEPPSYEKLAFQDFEEAFGGRGRDDLSSWFEATSAAGFRLSKVPSPYGQSGSIEGIGRLKCPWPEGAVLRLVPDNFDGLKMHFWNGASGITLVYHEEGNRWAAYQTTREGHQPTPKTWAITATDDDRCRRTGFRFGGPIELRFVADELMLSRGDVVLLTAPFAGRPSEVLFDGRMTIHGIALARTKDAPQAYLSGSAKKRILARAQAAELAPDVARAAEEEVEIRIQPAALEWKPTGSASGEAERLVDGAVRFRGEGAAFVAALPPIGLSEVVLELADITPGAGVFLGHPTGPPKATLRFCRDRKTGQMAAVMQSAEGASELDVAGVDVAPVPLVEKHCWVRLVQGCGNLRWWVSTDGEHWAQTEPAKTFAVDGNEEIGISLATDLQGGLPTLKQVVVRPLIWLRSLAGDSVQTLAYQQLEDLLDDAQSRAVSFHDQRMALDDAALLVLDPRDGGAMRRGILSRYVDLGMWGADHEGLQAWRSVREAFHGVPICSPLVATPDIGRAVRWELISDAYRHDTESTLDLIQRLRRFHQHRDRGLVEWAQWLASSSENSRQAAQIKDSWRELLIEDLSKEAYNSLTELRAVLEGEAWDDAARLIAAVRPDVAVGIAPSIQDPSLLTSVPVAIQLVLQQYPQVRDLLAQNHATAAKLRISQAIRGGDARAIELATVQFRDLPAAGDAERWLADRALMEGRFSTAAMRYQRAMQMAPELTAELMPRLRLAAAMQGEDAGESARKAVQIGEQSIAPADFERLILEMRERHAAEARWQRSAVVAATIPQPAARYVAKPWARFEGPAGERPQEEVAKRTAQFRVPWVDRQLATTVDDGVLYVANRFQVAAYALADGRKIWQSETPAAAMQRAQDWPLTPMRPLVRGDRLFVRLLYSANPLSVCLDKANGKIVWTAETRERESFVSDPIWLNNQLVMLSVSHESDESLHLRQYSLSPRTGDVIARYDLLRLRKSWATRSCAQVAPCDDGLVAVLGGVTLSISSEGEVRWVRKHLVLPAEDDPRWILQTQERPLVAGERVYVAQPGVRTVECLDTATGRSYWQAVLPEVVGIVGIAGEVLVVRTETDVRGLDLKDGSTRWRFGGESVVGFPICDQSQVLVAVKAGKIGEESENIQFTWLEADNGQAIVTAACQNLADVDPRLGPLVSFPGKILAFFGRGQQDPTRDIVELIPAAD